MNQLNPDFNVEARTLTAEAPFAVEELFFSRTDERGVIRSGNHVFQRLSGHAWDTLLNAPHKVIRHPDMPRGIFHLMWDRIKDGKPTGCYVKNRSKDGRFYWVFALVSPLEDGFVSVRLKPTCGLLDKVEPIYAELVRRENEEDLSPAESADAAITALGAAGFSSYESFQALSLALEYAARARKMGQALDAVQCRFTEMSEAISGVAEETARMTEAFRAIRTVPMNMSIIASRLENAGGPISAISVNYSQMLEEMASWVKTFLEGEDCVFARMRDAIRSGQFLCFSNALTEEMKDGFLGTDVDYPEIIDLQAEAARLSEKGQGYMAQTTASLQAVESEARRFARSVQDMKRYVTGLSSTRMMCKIESASLADSGAELAGIVDQLDAGQDEIEGRLARIVELNAVIQGNTSMLRSLL